MVPVVRSPSVIRQAMDASVTDLSRLRRLVFAGAVRLFRYPRL